MRNKKLEAFIAAVRDYEKLSVADQYRYVKEAWHRVEIAKHEYNLDVETSEKIESYPAEVIDSENPFLLKLHVNMNFRVLGKIDLDPRIEFRI
tara:strand:- start:243 stop:521 length:279 start_codon:yes stop_codon:yes gene_type:complete